MFKLKIIDHFSSAHNLRGYRGKCEELHGHNYKVELVVQGEKLDKIGMLCDFKILKKNLDDILQELDHKYLNKVRPFNKINPTAENIAKYIFYEIRKRIQKLDLIVYEVIVWESENQCAVYSEDIEER